MKKAWYMYCDDYNYGQRENGITAIKEIQDKTGNRISTNEINKILRSDFYADGAYKTKREYIKI